jgi:hypothetical protein
MGLPIKSLDVHRPVHQQMMCARRKFLRLNAKAAPLSHPPSIIDHQHHFAAAALHIKGGLTVSLLLGVLFFVMNFSKKFGRCDGSSFQWS